MGGIGVYVDDLLFVGFYIGGWWIYVGEIGGVVGVVSFYGFFVVFVCFLMWLFVVVIEIVVECEIEVVECVLCWIVVGFGVVV